MAESTRYEIKMVCEEWARDSVVAALRTCSGGVRTLYPERRVQSIYLDTTCGRSLEENLAGISTRRKVRFRWYGHTTDQVRGRLEMKVRENMLGWKHVAEIDDPVAVEGSDRVSFVRTLQRRAPLEWRLILQSGLEPMQWIAYTREYYATADHTVRVTVDRELQSIDQRWRFNLSRACPTALPRILIVEAKCLQDQYEHAQELINRLPLVVDKCSKFVIASSPGSGPTVSLLNRC